MDDDDSLGNFKKLTLPQGGTQDEARQGTVAQPPSGLASFNYRQQLERDTHQQQGDG